MKKTDSLPFLLLAVLAIGSAQAAMRAVEAAHELPLSGVSLPGQDNGRLTLRKCPRCSPEVLQVNAGTVYLVRPSGQAVSLSEFRELAGKITRRSQTPVYVYYDPETGHVRRMVLDEPL